MNQYWGYGQDTGFEVDKPDTDFLLQEMGGQTYLPDRTSSFKQGWIKEDYTPIDKLKDNNAAIAYGKYRKAYDVIVAESINRGYAPSSIRTNRELVLFQIWKKAKWGQIEYIKLLAKMGCLY